MPKVSQAHIDARRDQILDAATACFARHGIRETTIKAICAEAGLSAGALYRYFDSKEAMLAAVYERAVVQNRSFGEQLAAAEDPVAAIGHMVRGMVGFLSDPALRLSHQLSVRVHAAGLSDPELAARYVAVHRDVLQQLAPLLRSLQADGRIPAELDVDGFLWSILAAYQGLRIQSLLDPELDLDRIGVALQAMVMRSLRGS